MEINYNIFNTPEWYNKKYDGRKREFKGISRDEFKKAQEKAFYRHFVRTPYQAKSLLRRCYESVLDCSRPECGSYQKIAMYGATWLYLCSPVFGHRDYNKARLMPIQGNEKECEFLIKVSKRIANVK